MSVGLPNPVPIGIVYPAFVRNQRVELRAERIGRKSVAVSFVVVGGDQNSEIVIDAEVSIAAQFSGDNLLRLRIKALYSKVKVAAVIQDSEFCLFGGRLPLKRFTLTKVTDEACVLPTCVFQRSIEFRSLVSMHGTYGPSR